MRGNTLRGLLFLAAGIGGCSLMNAQAPVLYSGGVVNAADYSRAVSEGTLVALFGKDLAPGTQAAEGLPLPGSLLGVSVEVLDGQNVLPAPLLMVSPGQINAQLPYGLVSAAPGIRVRTAGGTSNVESLAVPATAPRLFTFSWLGTGSAAATSAAGKPIAENLTARPGDIVSLWLTGLGAVEPPVEAGMPAGDGSPSKPYNRLPAQRQVTISVRGRTSNEILYAGLAPNWAGLYQVNFRLPYDEAKGDLPLYLNAGGSSSQDGVFLPTVPNGFYFIVPAGKAPNGQTMNGAAGASSALAFAHTGSAAWAQLGQEGKLAWSKNTGLDSKFSAVTGLALTLRNQETIVYDNNGIETGAHQGFYDNYQRGPDAEQPGLLAFYSNSVRDSFVFAGHFRLESAATFDTITGYFDGMGLLAAPFDPSNFYNTFEMNIHSDGPGHVPGHFVEGYYGDLLSTDHATAAYRPGRFSFSDTGLERVFFAGASKPIYRLSYRLDVPLTLPAGDYWFSHSLKVPKLTGAEGANSKGSEAHYSRPAEPAAVPYWTTEP